jgi:hypothetical protein
MLETLSKPIQVDVLGWAVYMHRLSQLGMQDRIEVFAFSLQTDTSQFTHPKEAHFR